jgi:hypothetical protein
MDTSFNVYRKGDTFRGRSYQFPFDITGVTAICEFKNKINGPVIFSYRTDDNTITVDLVAKELVFTERLFDYPEGIYIYEVVLTLADGSTTAIPRDKLVIFEDV